MAIDDPGAQVGGSPVIYLTGGGVTSAVERVDDPRFGVMVQPNGGLWRRTGRFRHWAADTGCFAAPERFDLGRYIGWLEGLIPHRASCLFATAPDRVGDAEATLSLRQPGLEKIRGLGLPAAFVAQDGLENLAVPWDEFDVLFIGGTTVWKMGPAPLSLVQEAKARGKWAHMGRVNSRRRFTYAASIGCDSVDGTFLAFGPTRRMPEIKGWVDSLTLWEQA